MEIMAALRINGMVYQLSPRDQCESREQRYHKYTSISKKYELKNYAAQMGGLEV